MFKINLQLFAVRKKDEKGRDLPFRDFNTSKGAGNVKFGTGTDGGFAPTLRGGVVPHNINAEMESVLSPQQSIAAQQRKLIEAARSRKISSLESAQQRALGATGLQKKEEAQARIGQRTGVKTASDKASRRLSEMLAAQGLSRSGAQTGGQIAQDVTRQQGISDSLAGEATALGRIGQRESDIRQQTAQGIAQAGIDADISTQQAALAQLQQEAARKTQLEDLQANRDFEAQRQADLNTIAQNKLELEREWQKADALQDFDRKKELEILSSELNKDEIRLRESFGGSGGSRGLTFSQDRQAFQDQVKQGVSGINALIGRLGEDPSGADQTSSIYSYLSQLEAQGYDPSVIDAIARSVGINPQSDRLGLTEQGALGSFKMPTF